MTLSVRLIMYGRQFASAVSSKIRWISKGLRGASSAQALTYLSMDNCALCEAEIKTQVEAMLPALNL